eukprot:5207816-Heterocapsa_arctica.AAC.1
MASGGFSLSASGRMVAAFVKYYISAGPTDSFRRDEVAAKPNAHASGPFLRCLNKSFRRVEGSDPLVVLVFMVADVFKSVNIMEVVGFPPSILQLDDFVLVHGLGYGILQRRSVRGDGIL